MSLLDLKIDGTSTMELNVLAVAAVYETLTISSKVLGDDGKIPVWLFGRNALYANSGPPSVTWIPSSGTIEGPATLGGALADDGTTRRDRAIFDRMLTFDVYCNGRSYKETENLVVSVAAAVKQALLVGTKVTGETWTTEQESNHDNALNLIQAILTVDMRIPVIDEESALTVVNFQAHTEELDC